MSATAQSQPPPELPPLEAQGPPGKVLAASAVSSIFKRLIDATDAPTRNR